MRLGAVMGMALLLVFPDVARAAVVDIQVTPPSPQGELYFGIEQAARGQGGPGAGGPSCTWTLLSLPGQTGLWDPYRDSAGILWQAWSKACAGQALLTYWVPVLPPRVVVAAWRDDLIKKIPATEPVWSPLMPTQYKSYPTYVWVDQASVADVVLAVNVPSARATMTAKATRVVFDPGVVADAVTCKGVPVKRTDCSYTYRETSKDQPNLRYSASVSVTWEISWSATTGESGTLPSYVSTKALPIAVAKIQTVGG